MKNVSKSIWFFGNLRMAEFDPQNLKNPLTTRSFLGSFSPSLGRGRGCLYSDPENGGSRGHFCSKVRQNLIRQNSWKMWAKVYHFLEVSGWPKLISKISRIPMLCAHFQGHFWPLWVEARDASILTPKIAAVKGISAQKCDKTWSADFLEIWDDRTYSVLKINALWI